MADSASHASTEGGVAGSPVGPERLTAAPRAVRPHWTLFDGLRGIAAQIIVWHHLASYGPVVDSAAVLVPVVIDWLFDYGRMAVHLFLVIGGYLAAEGLSSQTNASWSAVGQQLGRRFLRLSLPYWFALLAAIGANAWADRWIDDPMISAPPDWISLLAHLCFAFNILGIESLSAGFWYLAIDLQLTIATVVIVAAMRQLTLRWLPRQSPIVLAQAVLLPLALAALFHWNLSDDHDWWFGFFFGSYYLGMTAAWCNRGELPRWYGLCVVAIAIAALAVEWRPRLVLALAATGLFMIGHARGWLSSWLRGPVWSYLGRHSYSLFLIHFPLCLVMNGLCATATAGRPWLALTAMFATYFTSLLAADLLSRTVEWLQTQSRRWLTAGS